MPNELFTQYGGQTATNPMIQKILQFKNSFSGNPQQIIQGMLNSGRINQAQLNQYAQQANELYKLFK